MKKIVKLLIISAILFLVGSMLFGIGIFIHLGAAEEIVENYTYTETADNLNIVCDVDEYDISFVFSDSAEAITVEYTVIKKVKGKVISSSSIHESDGALIITGGTNEMLSIFDFSVDRKKITVTIPSSRELGYRIKASTGDVCFGDGVKASAISVSTSTGDVIIGDSNIAGNLTVDVSTGNIGLIGDVFADEIKLDGGVGDVTIHSAVRADSLEVEVSTGDVLIMSNVDISSIDIESSTGDIRATGVITSEEIEVETSTGDVSLTLLGERELYSAKVRVSTGHSNITSGGDGERVLDISVGTGDVNVTFKKLYAL